MDTSKLIKNAKRLDTLLKVLQRILVISMIVAAIVFLILTVANSIDPGFVIGEALNEIDVGPITITLAEGYTPNDGSILSYAWVLFALAAVSVAVIWYAIRCVRKILHSAIQGNPFYARVGRDIRKIGFVCIALGIVDNMAEVIEVQNLLWNYGLNRLIDGTSVHNITANHTLDLTYLILFCVLFLLSYIFEYGAQLQQLSDETL